MSPFEEKLQKSNVHTSVRIVTTTIKCFTDITIPWKFIRRKYKSSVPVLVIGAHRRCCNVKHASQWNYGGIEEYISYSWVVFLSLPQRLSGCACKNNATITSHTTASVRFFFRKREKKWHKLLNYEPRARLKINLQKTELSVVTFGMVLLKNSSEH